VYGSSASTPSSTSEGGSDVIGFHDCNFVWSLGDKDSSTSFQLRIDGELYFSKGKVTLITGPTSCGKTSLLYALMGEMHLVEGTQRSRFNLPREKGVAFVAQESWVQNDTIKVGRIVTISEETITAHASPSEQCSFWIDFRRGTIPQW
jgi:translation initiation factor RLI1